MLDWNQCGVPWECWSPPFFRDEIKSNMLEHLRSMLHSKLLPAPSFLLAWLLGLDADEERSVQTSPIWYHLISPELAGFPLTHTWCQEDGYDVDIFNDQGCPDTEGHQTACHSCQCWKRPGSDPEIEEILKAQLADLPLQETWQCFFFSRQFVFL